jgi:hypothetical protein
MSITYEHSSMQRDPLRAAPRTLRDAQLDPFDWIERPEAANDVGLMLEPAQRGRPAMVIGTVRLALGFALVVLALVVALVHALVHALSP